jgi:cytochrome c5
MFSLHSLSLRRSLDRLLAVTVVAAALATGACATSLPPPSEADATRAATQWPGTTLETLSRGRMTYLDHCTSCHAAYRPDTKPAAAWRKIVQKMATRSKLDHQSTEDVVRYLVSSSRR